MRASKAPVPLFPAVTDQTQIKSLASITGRVGYAFWDNRFLGYVKAGGAWEQGNFSFQVGTVPVATASATRSGWTIGIGGEYAFLNWLTGFIEYDFYRFGNTNPSQDLGVHTSQLRDWVKKFADDPQYAFPGHGQMKPEQLEIARLKREVTKLKAERDILKKAAAYFAKEST